MSYRRFLLPFFILSIFILSCSGKEKTEPSADLQFFYLELCPGCEEYETADRLAEQVRSLGGTASNIIHDEDAAAMKKLLEEKGLERIAHALPLLLVEKNFFVGYEDIESEILRLKEE